MKFPAFEAIDLNLELDDEDLKVQEILIFDIFTDPSQPRKNFNVDVLQELATSITMIVSA